MADHQVVVAQLERLAIQQINGLAIRCQPHTKRFGALIGQLIPVVGVQWLAGFQHHQIGDVDHGVDAALAGGFQALLQPFG